MTDTSVNGGVQKRKRVADVVTEIFARVGDGFSDVTVGGEVHDGVDAGENVVELRLIGYVALDELEAFGQATETGGEIVVDDDLISGSTQCASGVTADVACASYN